MSDDDIIILEPLHNEDIERIVVDILCRFGAMRKVEIYEILQRYGYMVGADRLSTILRGMVKQHRRTTRKLVAMVAVAGRAKAFSKQHRRTTSLF